MLKEENWPGLHQSLTTSSNTLANWQVTSSSAGLIGNNVKVSVTYHGVGISKENQEKLFERCYRFH